MGEPEGSLFRWIFEMLLGGLSAAIAWWVNNVQSEHRALRDKQITDTSDLHDRLTRHQQQSADTYARRDDVREAFSRIEAKLDQLVEHAIHGSGK